MRPETPLKSFKSEHSFGMFSYCYCLDQLLFHSERRKQLAMKLRTMYPDRLPIIVEKAPNSQAPDICKKKYVDSVFITL